MAPESSEMSPAEIASPDRSTITVRYWAAARAAAGVDRDVLEVDGPTSVAEVVVRASERHPGTRLPEVLKVCSVLVGERPVQQRLWGSVFVPAGGSIEFLPPFAGG